MPTRREFLTQAATASAAAAAFMHATDGTAQNRTGGTTASMQTSNIPHTDREVSRLAYGVGMLSVSWRSTDFVAKSLRAIRTAYDNGITFFDTADVYAEGQSEEALGDFLKESPGRREKVVIQSKCGMRLADRWMPGNPIGPNTFGVDLSRKHIVKASEQTLKRLRLDHLDILLLHAHHPLAQPEEIAQAFDELNDSGKVRYFGVSSYNVVQLELLKKYVRQPLVVNQIRLSLAHYPSMAEGSSFGGLVDYCRAQGIQVQAFSPLKAGLENDGPVLLNPPPDASPQVRQVVRMLAEVAKNHDTTAAVVMLAWLLRHPAGIVPIIGATNPQHIVENCVADRVTLSHEQWTDLFNAAAAIQPSALHRLASK